MEHDISQSEELYPLLAWLGFVLVAVIVICTCLERLKSRESDRRWQSRIERVSGTPESDLQKLFAAWQERVAHKNGHIELWSGTQSDVLFIEAHPKCSFQRDRYWVPCWTVWARTRQSQRFYTLVIRVDVDDDWRLAPDLRHDEVDGQSVTSKALELGKSTALKKTGVVEVDA